MIQLNLCNDEQHTRTHTFTKNPMMQWIIWWAMRLKHDLNTAIIIIQDEKKITFEFLNYISHLYTRKGTLIPCWKFEKISSWRMKSCWADAYVAVTSIVTSFESILHIIYCTVSINQVKIKVKVCRLCCVHASSMLSSIEISNSIQVAI